MNKLIGVRFEKCGRIYYFYTGGDEVKLGDKVIAESDMGLEVGTVFQDDLDEAAVKASDPIKAILRTAGEDDFKKCEENEALALEAESIFKEKTVLHGLDMKLIRVKYLFDRKKILFYYYADDRVDFRALVRDLASVFHTRIELRQIGVRDVARIVGGLGVCGRPSCCASHMSGRSNVNIRMAKNQGLVLNPAGLTGACGRLMCCLEHENTAYEELREGMPSNGDLVADKKNRKKTGKVVGANVLLRKCKVVFEEENGDSRIEYLSADDLELIKKRRGKDADSDDLSTEAADEKDLQRLTED